MNKSDLRKAYLERRRSISYETHSEQSSKISRNLFAAIDPGTLKAIQSFISMRHFGEVETQLVLEYFWESHPDVLTTAPRIDDVSGEIESVIFQRETPLVENKWKIPEPAGEQTLPPKHLDLVIVPLLCFDAQGHRVGYGRGFYDRFLRKCRPDCIKAGLSFFPPVDLIDDAHGGDVRLDLCITPRETYRFS